MRLAQGPQRSDASEARTFRSRVKHSTTEPLRSLHFSFISGFVIPRRSQRDIVLASSVHSDCPHFKVLSVRNHISVPIGPI